jgi:hypothetical protein
MRDEGNMDLNNTLKELREERQRIEEAILSLERLILSRGQRRRGRPPKWLAEARNDRVPKQPKKQRA